MDAGIDESERLQILGESLPKLCGFATETLPELVGAVFQIALFYAYGVQINIWITSALLLAAALVVFYQYRQIEKSSENYEEGERLEAEFAGFTRSAVSNHEIVQAALDIDKLGESAISKMGARNKSWLLAMIPFFKNTSIGTAAFHIAGFLGIVFGALLFLLGYISLGAVFAFYLIAQGLLDAVGSLPKGFSETMNARGVNAFADTLYRQPLMQGEKAKKRIKTLSLKDVHFRYKSAETDAVDGVRHTFSAGEFVCIKGENGSGKSTLGALLAGRLLPKCGKILADDLPLEEIRPESLSEDICYCPQSSSFFTGSIEENISGSMRNTQDLQEKCRAFGGKLALSIAQRLREEISAQGDPLSAEEKQLLAFMRAGFYKTPSFFIADEITSSMDEETSLLLAKKLRAMADAGAGVIFITHNDFPDSCFDRILYMKGGKLA